MFTILNPGLEAQTEFWEAKGRGKERRQKKRRRGRRKEGKKRKREREGGRRRGGRRGERGRRRRAGRREERGGEKWISRGWGRKAEVRRVGRTRGWDGGGGIWKIKYEEAKRKEGKRRH